MKKFSTRILFLFAVLAFLALAGCTGNTGVTPPAPSATTVPLSKYTVAAASISASPGNPFTSQVSVTPFGATTKVNLITITKSTSTGTPTFTETISTSSPAAYPALQAAPLPLMTTAGGTLPNDPLAAEQAVRAREQQLMASVNPASARSAFQQTRMQALMAPNAVATASLGATSTFNVYNFNTAGNQVVNATCQYMGTNAYIFVDNTIIGGAGTTYASGSAQLAAISTAFDAIYATDRATFGSEWGGAAPGNGTGGIDSDPKIYILISPAVNSGATNGILGYFYGGDEYPKALVSLSNQHEMFYVVSRAQGAVVDLWADAATPPSASAKTGYAILAHEFQHMINFNTKFGKNGLYTGVMEDTWLNEGLSMYAMQACGYGMPNGDTTSAGWVQNYLSSPSLNSLTNWNPASPGYGTSYLFVLYLVEHYGGIVGSPASQAMLQAMESNGSVGIANVETVTGAGTFGAVFKNWAMANLLDHVTTSAAYNYTSINLNGANPPGGPTLTGITPIITNTTYPLTATGTQPGWSTLYQRFTGGTNNALNISITSTTSVNNLEGIVVVQ